MLTRNGTAATALVHDLELSAGNLTDSKDMALELPRSSEKGNYSNDQTLLENDTKTKIPIQSMVINATESQNTQEQHAEDNEVLFIIDIRFCNETRFC